MFWWADLITFHLVPMLLVSVKAESSRDRPGTLRLSGMQSTVHVGRVITEPWRGTLARPNCSLRHSPVVCACYTAYSLTFTYWWFKSVYLLYLATKYLLLKWHIFVRNIMFGNERACGVLHCTYHKVWMRCLGNTACRFEFVMTVTMNNADFLDIKTQFVPHRKYISSPLQSSAG
jgi:hypothetical protein